MPKLSPFRSHCPINFCLDILGDSWSLLIVRDMVFMGKRSYGEFLGSPERISTNILADRLYRLEHYGLIEQTVDSSNRTKKIYSLTAKGKDLIPVLVELIRWGGKYDEETEAPESFLRRIDDDRERLIDEIRNDVSTHSEGRNDTEPES